MHKKSKLYAQIDDNLKLTKFIIIFIIHNHNKQAEYLVQPTKQPRRLHKLDNQARKVIIRYIK